MGLFNGDADGYGGRDYDLYPLTTRERIKQFNIAFGRPVNAMPITPSVSDRILLGKILLEEVIETITLGLGLTIDIKTAHSIEHDVRILDCDDGPWSGKLDLSHTEGDLYDPVETADGMGDVNVVNHFMAHWLGINLDKVTAHIDDSNMSKMGEDGQAIINRCKYRLEAGHDCEIDGGARCELIDESKPEGKILKGPNFWDAKPGIPAILAEGNN